MTHIACSGHPGGSLGCTELFVVLYFSILEHDPVRFDLSGRNADVFFLSNGHISPVWYATLARRGYFPLHELKSFRKINSRLQGHPANKEGLPGVRIASGSLGQGLSVALGVAEAKRMDKDEHLVYVLMGDGEQQEGQIWEAAMYAAHRQVDNLVAIIDHNGQQIDGRVEEVMDVGQLRTKYESFGWQVVESEGNDLRQVMETLHVARSFTRKGKPVLYLMRTRMGYGVDFMCDDYRWHGKAPNDNECARALAQLPETLGDF